MFEHMTEPVFIKEDSDAQKQLEALEHLAANASDEALKRINREIKLVKAGIAGENSLAFELKNSHMPMYVLHDLRLERNGIAAQIDFLVVTRICNFIIECKNLVGDIEINSKGDFVRTFSYGAFRKREGLYSPITQNQRHLDLLKDIRSDAKGNFLTKALFLRHFHENYHGVIVLANQRTVLNDRYATKELKSQIVRADQLVSHIRSVNEASRLDKASEKETRHLAEFFLSHHVPNTVDYIKRYRSSLELESGVTSTHPVQKKNFKNETSTIPSCPRCGQPMVKRTAQRGSHAGESFWGCANYPNCRGTIYLSKSR